jgi:small subunit ribosomal protein S8
MTMTDPIADMLTRLRNANKAYHEYVDIPSSRIKEEIAKILRGEGYVAKYEVHRDEAQGILRIYLKYGKGKKKTISGVRRISKPGRRVYVRKNDIPKVLGGLGIAILSTPRGLLTGDQARSAGVGGEVICYVW